MQHPKIYFIFCRILVPLLLIAFVFVPLIICGHQCEISATGIMIRIFFDLSLIALCASLIKLFRNKIAVILLTTVFSMLIAVNFLLQGLELYNFYMQGKTFNFAFYTTMIDLPLIMEMLPGQVNSAISGIAYVLCTVILFVVFILCTPTTPKTKKKWMSSAIFSGVLLCAVFVFGLGETAPGNFCRMIKYANISPDIEIGAELSDKSEYFRNFGITVCSVTKDSCAIYDKGNHKNLLLIILESTEKQFMDETRFPGLTPNLNRFKNSDGTIWFDKMHNSANNTAESMIETFWGMPSFPTFSSSGGTGGFNKKMLNAFVSMPYIFVRSGYTWDHIQTAPLSGMGVALMEEGARIGFIDELNLTFDFGKRDHYVFDYAWRMFERRANGKKPFALSISTIDAHTPNGFVDSNTLSYPNKNVFQKNYGNFQLLDAIYNCDYHLGDFISKVLHSPAGKNTVIAIMNDHNFMGNASGKLSGERDCVFMILNTGGRNICINEQGCQMDISPTLLDYMGIKTNYIFPVGVSLLKNTDKNYHLRRKCTSNNRLELCRYAKEKLHQVQNNAGKVFFDNNTDNVFNILGTEIPVNDSDRLFIIKLNNQGEVISASYQYYSNHALLEDALNSTNPAVFIFHGIHDKFGAKLCQKLKLNPPPEAYGLIFKDAHGHFSVVLSLSKNDLVIDTKSIGDSEVNIRNLYPKIKQHGKKVFLMSDFSLKNCQTVASGDFISMSGVYSFLSSLYCFPVSHGGNVDFSTRIKNVGTNKTRCYCGFILYDKDFYPLDGKNFPYQSKEDVFAVVHSEIGSDVITVSGHPKVAKKCHIARNAKSDGADLPNRNLLAHRVVSVRECENGCSEIRLSKPLDEKIPAGEKIRIHGIGGGYFYKWSKVLAPGQEETVNFSIGKNDDVTMYSQKYFPRGTYFIRPLVLSYSTPAREKNTIEISHATLSW